MVIDDFNPYKAEIFLYKSCFCSIIIIIFYYFGTVFMRQNLASTDVRFTI